VACGVRQVRYEVHFNVQGTGFDGTIKRGALPSGALRVRRCPLALYACVAASRHVVPMPTPCNSHGLLVCAS
jgi:hypothetical protein